MIFLIKKIKVTVNYIKKEFFYVHSNFNFFLIIRKIFVIEGNFIIRKISYFFIKRRSNDLSFLFKIFIFIIPTFNNINNKFFPLSSNRINMEIFFRIPTNFMNSLIFRFNIIKLIFKNIVNSICKFS